MTLSCQPAAEGVTASNWMTCIQSHAIVEEAILMGLEPYPELQTQGEMDLHATETLLQLGR